MKYILIFLILSTNGASVQKVEFGSLTLCNLFKATMNHLSHEIENSQYATLVVLGGKCFKTHDKKEG